MEGETKKIALLYSWRCLSLHTKAAFDPFHRRHKRRNVIFTAYNIGACCVFTNSTTSAVVPLQSPSCLNWRIINLISMHELLNSVCNVSVFLLFLNAKRALCVKHVKDF